MLKIKFKNLTEAQNINNDIFTKKSILQDLERAKAWLLDHYHNPEVQQKLTNMRGKDIKPFLPKIYNIIKSNRIKFIPTKNADADAYAESTGNYNLIQVPTHFEENYKYLKSEAGKDHYYSVLIHEINHNVFAFLNDNNILISDKQLQKDILSKFKNPKPYENYWDEPREDKPESIPYAFIPTEQNSRFLQLKAFLNLPHGNITVEQLIDSFKNIGIQLDKINNNYYGLRFKNYYHYAKSSIGKDRKFHYDSNYDIKEQDNLKKDFLRTLEEKFKSGSYYIQELFKSVFVGFFPLDSDYSYFGIDLEKLVDYNNKILAAAPQNKQEIPV